MLHVGRLALLAPIFAFPALSALSVMSVMSVMSVSSCSSKEDGDSNTTPPPGNPVFTARFDLPKTGVPDLLTVPFPSDLMLAANGTIVVKAGTEDAPNGIDRIVPRSKGAKFVEEALARTHGFGTYAGAIFEVTGGAPDVTKLPTGSKNDCTSKDSAVLFIDLDAGKPLECIAGYNDDALFGQESSNGTPLATVVVVRTARGVVVPEGHHVVVLLTDGIVTKAGAVPLAASPQFMAIRDGQRDSDNEKLYGDAIDSAATKIGFDKKHVVAASVYTAGKVGDELRAAREVARSTPVPTLKWTGDDVAPVMPAKFTATSPLPAGWTASLDDLFGTPNKLADGTDDPDWGDTNPGAPHDAIGAMGVASFDAPSLIIAAGDYGDADHGTFFHDASGNVGVDPKQPTAKIWVTFMVPKGAMPAKGWPVVVYQHGMGGQRGDALSMANTYARKGWATASIEVVLQGTRGLDADKRGDRKSDYHRSTSKYTGPDGFSDKTSDGSNYDPTDLFGDLYRIAALRDQFRQSAIDHTTLARILRASPTLDGLADGGVVPLIDGSKVAYSGVSLGGIIGAITAAIEPDHAAYFLDVPGGGLFTDLAANSPNIYTLLHTAAALFFGFDHAQVPWSHPFVQLLQHVVDGMDPVALAGTVNTPLPIAGVMPKPRNVLMVEDLADELVSNPATEALARSMGVPLITPHAPVLFATLAEVDGAAGIHDLPRVGTTGVLLQVYPAQHGGELVNKTGKRTFATPYGQFGDVAQDPFPRLATPVTFDNPYLELQTTVTRFLGDAFDGKVPTVVWSKAPQTP